MKVTPLSVCRGHFQPQPAAAGSPPHRLSKPQSQPPLIDLLPINLSSVLPRLLYVVPPHGQVLPKMKRHHSPVAVGGAGSRAKKTRTASVRTETTAEDQQSSEIHHEIDISVSLRSAKKAERNDPRPRSPLDQACQQILGTSGSPRAIGNTNNPRVPDPARKPSPAAQLGLADRQDAAKHGNQVGPAPTANPGQASQEESSDENNE